MKFYSKVEPVHLFSAADAPNRLPYSEAPLQPLQNARKDEQGGGEQGGVGGSNVVDAAASMLPVNIANGSINISMGKMMPTNAATKMAASMSPSLSLSKMSNVIPNLGQSTSGSATSTSTTFSTGGGATGVNGAMNQVGGAMNQVGQAAGGLIGGVFGMVKDAVNKDEHSTAGATGTTSTASTSRPGMPPIVPPAGAQMSTAANRGLASGAFGGIGRALMPGGTSATTAAGSQGLQQQHMQQQQQQQHHLPEMQLPDGQRLAYRMDYKLRETGNTYIAAITSHTTYWSNPDVAHFMLCKLHPEIEYYYHDKQPTQQQQQQQQQQHHAAASHQQKRSMQPVSQAQAFHQQQQQQQQQQQHVSFIISLRR